MHESFWVWDRRSITRSLQPVANNSQPAANNPQPTAHNLTECGAAPGRRTLAMNQSDTVLHEPTGANCAQTIVTITLIAKWCIYEICVIYRSFTSWSPIYHIFNIDRIVVKKLSFWAILAVCFKAALSILKISWIEDREVKERWIIHIPYIHHFVIGPILADLIGPTFCHLRLCSWTEKRETFFFPIFPTIGSITQQSDWSAHGACRLCELTGQYTEPSHFTGWPVTPRTDILRELTRTNCRFLVFAPAHRPQSRLDAQRTIEKNWYGAMQ